MLVVSQRLSSAPRGFTQFLAAALKFFRLPTFPCPVGFPRMAIYFINLVRSVSRT